MAPGRTDRQDRSRAVLLKRIIVFCAWKGKGHNVSGGKGLLPRGDLRRRCHRGAPYKSDWYTFSGRIAAWVRAPPPLSGQC